MSEALPPETLRELVAARIAILRLSRRAGAGLVGGLVLVNVVLGALPVAFVIATSVVLGRVPAAVEGGLSSSAWRSLVTVFVLGAAAFVGQQILAPLVTSLSELVARRIDGQMFRELMSASLSSPGIAPLEDQRVLGELRLAATELQFGVQSPGQACAGALALIPKYLQLLGYAVVIGVAFSWLAAAGLTVTVLMFRYGQRGGLRRYARKRITLDAYEREIEYLRQLAIQPAAGKEIRIFGLANWLGQRLRQVTIEFLKPMWSARRHVYMWPFVWFATWGLLVTVAVFAAIGSASTETFSLVTFALVVQSALAALRLGEYYPESDLQTTIGMLAYDAVQRFAGSVRGYPAVTPGPQAGSDVGPTGRTVPEPQGTIHFDNVTFRYPGQDRPVFEGLDLRIPVGACTAIVGLNGAGKTTLVKLLARLYEPTSGTVRVDGVDIRSYPIEQWRTRLGVIFQQFARYEASAADNIAYGAVGHLDDSPGIRAAAADVGIVDALDRLPRGLDTPLARHLSGGAELSGGQWQRVALARALFALRHGARVLVLDEPTASLDIRAEAHFFDEFARLTESATTLLISHRFSTVRHADLIVVLEQGRVLEQGSHETLLAEDGRYAELFRLQGDRFTDARADKIEAVVE
ncbi:ABC transporter ATP-binding protein [Micromonospora sp. NPDC049523]|uniref:ABC transporter ATP-binding protein n=1 Tax=Micromonospora sp. NPDC049523 TaxID=3155921 RepID=UPI003425CD5B